jgi:hypothetical protein
MLSIRYEKLALSTREPQGEHLNSLRGRIVNIAYSGASSFVHVRIHDTLTLTVCTPGRPEQEIGAEMVVSWPFDEGVPLGS